MYINNKLYTNGKKTILYQLIKNLIGLKVQLLDLNRKPTMTTAQNWSNLDTLDYSITLTKPYLLFLYNHYLLKISELKNQVSKLRFQI
jgi:hypothetical protein